MVLGLIIGLLYLFTDVLYWAKWAASVISLRHWKRIHRNRFDLYDFEVENQPEKLCVLVPNEERILESPFLEEHLHNAADEIFMYGVNEKSQALVVRVSRAPNDEADAGIYLKLEDGRWYELQERAGYQRNYGGKCTSFTCGGLQMHYLIPMRRWRVVYCGMLKEVMKKGEKTEEKTVFVKFAFLWSASSDVFDPSCEFDIRQTADSMANAKWSSFIPPVDKVSETLNFYYQSGVLSGIVSIEDQPDAEMYLLGERIRYLATLGKAILNTEFPQRMGLTAIFSHNEYGKFSYAVGCKFKHILGVTPKSGLVVHLGRASVPNTFHNLPFGFIVHPDGLNRVIEDGIIISKLSGTNAPGKELTAMFKAGRQYELRGNFVGDGVRFTSEKSWKGHLEFIGIEFEVDGLKGSGFMMYGEIPKLPDRKPQRIPPSLSAAKPLTVFFTDDASHLTDLTGGKGSSLGMLTKLSNEIKSEFIVPKGIIVTTASYQELLTSDIIDKIEKMKDIAYGNVAGNIQEACKIVTAAIERSYLPDKITKEIEEKLHEICDGNISQQKFAVRSSATGEDTDQMSAAGQMDTFLGVQGLKEIFTSVKKCWASQFGYIATEYKRQNGQILNSPMAVVIQKMVECEAAGVLFTCDPVTNNPSVTFITGNYGLGESVVSGSEEPDTVVLKKLPMNEIEINSVTVGLKHHKIVMTDANSTDDEGTVTTEDVPEDKRNECCISQDMAIRLGKLSMEIEEHFKSPRDIEWGIKDNTIYILQSRPITTGVAVSDYEIKHEFDGPIRCEGDFFSISNVGEVMPGATSPLGIEVIGKSHTAVFQKNAMRQRQKNTFQQHKYFPSGCCVPFYNHMTLTVVDLVTRVGAPDSTASQSMMVAFFGRILVDPDLKVIAKYREAGEMEKNLMYYFHTLKNLFFSWRGVEELKEKTFSYQIPAEKGETSREIFDLVMKSCSHTTEPLLKHIFISEMSSLWNMYLLSVLGMAKRSIDTEVYSDFATLLSSSSNVESADVPSAIQKLAHAIVKDADCENFKSMTVEEAENWLQTSTSLSGYKFRQFIKRHGHRCLKEFDMHSLPWGIDPKPLIKILKNMLGSCENIKEKKEENFSQLLSRLKVPLDFKTKLLLRFLLPNCRRGVRMRETCKSIVMKAMDNMRRGFQHLSKTMVAEGYLPDTDLLYFLTLDEINELLETRNPGILSRANHRRKLFPTLDSYMLPEIWRGRPIPMNENEDDVEYVADLTMKGIPVSQGTVKAYARIALTIDEASHLKPGEVLIAHCTDIGWCPYFPILAGVVTELGGLISHDIYPTRSNSFAPLEELFRAGTKHISHKGGAVVSREYGLPCVVGLHGATKQFHTGDYVLLDGNKGILQRLTPPEQ